MGSRMVLGMSDSLPFAVQIGLAAPRVAVVFNGGQNWHYWHDWRFTLPRESGEGVASYWFLMSTA